MEKIHEFDHPDNISSVIRQKGESRSRCFKKTKHVKFSEKRAGGKKCSFFVIFDVLCFIETPVLRFALLPYTDEIDDGIPDNF